ncbi:MAG: adenosylcobinamide amidohydrolase, partial [Pseudomonadota bacterium]
QRMMSQGESVGTINIAVATNLGLTEQARLEAMSIIVQARTAAILEQRAMLVYILNLAKL